MAPAQSRRASSRGGWMAPPRLSWRFTAVLWRNLLVEEGWVRFEEVTQLFSLPGEDIRFPYFSFASAVADFNNDGWQDFVLFNEELEPDFAPFGPGHGFFINQNGLGFINKSVQAGVNIGNNQPERSRGCQVADLNADGRIDNSDFSTFSVLFGTTNTQSPPDCL